jgi:hypothetical protein
MLEKIAYIINNNIGQEKTMWLIDRYLTLGEDENAVALRITNLSMLVGMWKADEINALEAIKSIRELIEDPSKLVNLYS